MIHSFFHQLITDTGPWKRNWCWERLKARGEEDNRAWDGLMASPTRWTWVWVSSGSWWWTGKPGTLQSTESQRVRYNWATELMIKSKTGISCDFRVFQGSKNLAFCSPGQQVWALGTMICYTWELATNTYLQPFKIWLKFF